jgi:hypothetical protein
LYASRADVTRDVSGLLLAAVYKQKFPFSPSDSALS